MALIRSIIMAFSLFSRVPMPKVEWKPESMRYMMAAFPLVGAVIGLALWGWLSLCGALGANAFVAAAGMTALPVLVTGGIHLDGFCDVVDAQSSHADPARKRQILKDPHIGAFAVVGAVLYLLCYCACASELAPETGHLPSVQLVVLLGAVHVLTRAGSGIATTAFPKAGEDGMLAMEHDSARTRPVLAVLAAFAMTALACTFACSLIAGAVFACAWAVSLTALKRFARTQFGGMSGDVAGYYLQCTELALIVALVALKLTGCLAL